MVTGSANFSKASTISNDENMLVIRGDTDVADVYLTEFMRLFTHYEFRARVAAQPGSAGTAAPGVTTGRRYLDPTSTWVQPVVRGRIGPGQGAADVRRLPRHRLTTRRVRQSPERRRRDSNPRGF